MAKVKSMCSSRLVYLLFYLTILSAINRDNQRLKWGDVLLAQHLIYSSYSPFL